MMRMYSVYDRVSKQYLEPVCFVNDQAAIRGFVSQCVQLPVPDAFIKDLSLVHIGMFDEVDGCVAHSKHEVLFYGDDPSLVNLRKEKPYAESHAEESYQSE